MKLGVLPKQEWKGTAKKLKTVLEPSIAQEAWRQWRGKQRSLPGSMFEV